MPVIIQATVGNLAPSYAFTLKRNGTIINLATATSVVMNIINPRTDAITGSGVSCVVLDAANGLVQYSPLAAHFPTGGRYWGEFKITYSGALPETLNKYVDFVIRNKFV